MRTPEEKLIDILQDSGVDFAATLPCEKFKNLLNRVTSSFQHVALTREEEGVGICAGAALAGKRPAMFVQSSGVGNMINALLSLTGFYQLPLAVFVSQRGIYKEKIAAQLPMGRRLAAILDGARIRYSEIRTENDIKGIPRRLEAVYKKNVIHGFLLSPALWEASSAELQPYVLGGKSDAVMRLPAMSREPGSAPACLTRYEILEIIAPYLDHHAVVCNLGIPSKELFAIRHQTSNFYMLGSMGMATPIGLGMALSSDRDVVVIDGDGSLLMNPGTLATVAHTAPKNFTIIATDNGSYGSTGDQPTLASTCVDLELVARGMGIRNTVKVSTRKQIQDALKKSGKGPRFIHVLTVPGSRQVPNIPLHHLEIKKQVMGFFSS